MRAVELAKVAASAEALRLRRIVVRQGMRGAYGAGAAVFALLALAVLHVVIYQVVRLFLGPIPSSLIVLAIDVVAAGVLGALAVSNTPDAIEQEALQVRQQAMTEMRQAAGVVALTAEVTGLALRRRATGLSTTPPGKLGLLAAVVSRLMTRR